MGILLSAFSAIVLQFDVLLDVKKQKNSGHVNPLEGIIANEGGIKSMLQLKKTKNG